MLLQLGDQFRVTTDQRNFILEQLIKVTKRETKTEEWEWKEIGYFGKLEHALEKVLVITMLEQDEVDLKKLLLEIERLKDLIKTTVKKENILLKDYKEKKE